MHCIHDPVHSDAYIIRKGPRPAGMERVGYVSVNLLLAGSLVGINQTNT